MKTIRRCQVKDHGFTLVELIVVVTILALLVGVLTTKYLRRGRDAQIMVTKMQLAKIQSALDLAALDTGRYPSADEGLMVLTQMHGGAENWRGPYLSKEEELRDAWHRPIQYRIPCQHGGLHPYDLFSLGPNGLEDPGAGGDDIRNWE